jgi:protein-S-isoprenylcysteine O-methyltransferase Ste14
VTSLKGGQTVGPTWIPFFAVHNLLVFVAWAVLPFVAAGTVRWLAGWVYFCTLLVAVALHRAYVRIKSPELFQRRRQSGAGTKTWDLVWNLLFWPLMAATPAIAGLAVRKGEAPMPAGVWPVGAMLLATGFTISAWAMASNPHFEGTVRVQHDRAHRVVESGPYHLIRHPGYLGLILWALGTPLMLSSFWALLPAGAAAGWVVVRTALEDETLKRELGGYAEYAARTRFRLLPGVW